MGGYNVNMGIVTIPKKLIENDDLVIVPRRQYERFLDVFKKWREGEALNEPLAFKQSKKYAKFYEELNRDLAESIKEVNEGKFYGPFNSAKDLICFLKTN